MRSPSPIDIYDGIVSLCRDVKDGKDAGSGVRPEVHTRVSSSIILILLAVQHEILCAILLILHSVI